MIGKELKRLSRRELVDLIYQMKKNEQLLQDEIAALQDALQEKRIRLSAAGSIADAAASITNVFSVAQMTADLYLHEISCMRTETEIECKKKIDEASKIAAKIVSDGEKQCAALRARYQTDFKKWQQLQAELQSLEDQKTNGSYEDLGHDRET